jgi:hypothetical protein
MKSKSLQLDRRLLSRAPIERGRGNAAWVGDQYDFSLERPVCEGRLNIDLAPLELSGV